MARLPKKSRTRAPGGVRAVSGRLVQDDATRLDGRAAVPSHGCDEDVVDAAVGFEKGQARGVGVGPGPGPAGLVRVQSVPGVLVKGAPAAQRDQPAQPSNLVGLGPRVEITD
jgi:hypothetical protein